MSRNKSMAWQKSQKTGYRQASDSHVLSAPYVIREADTATQIKKILRQMKKITDRCRKKRRKPTESEALILTRYELRLFELSLKPQYSRKPNKTFMRRKKNRKQIDGQRYDESVIAKSGLTLEEIAAEKEYKRERIRKEALHKWRKANGY